MLTGHHCTYAHTFWKEPGQSGLHDHDYYEFFWVNEGTGYHLINGERLPLTPGMLSLIRPDDIHAFDSPPGGNLHITNFAFPASTWQFVHKRYFSGKPAFFSLKPHESRQYVLNPDKLLELRQAARDLESGARDLFAVERFLLDILAVLQAHWLLSEESMTPRWLLQACEDVRNLKNFEGGTMMFASKIAGRSPSHVARACKKYLGTTPTEIVNRGRMAYATSRLLTTDDTILSIALDCGVQSLAYFYRLFHKTYGLSPSAYRRHQRAVVVATGEVEENTPVFMEPGGIKGRFLWQPASRETEDVPEDEPKRDTGKSLGSTKKSSQK